MTNETELLQAVQQLADKDVAPFDLQIDCQAKLPNGLFQKIVDLGLLRAKIPKEYGGLDVPAATAGKIVNILAKANASVGVMLEGHYKSCDQLAKYGTDAAKKRYFAWAPKPSSASPTLNRKAAQTQASTSPTLLKRTAAGSSTATRS